MILYPSLIAGWEHIPRTSLQYVLPDILHRPVILVSRANEIPYAGEDHDAAEHQTGPVHRPRCTVSNRIPGHNLGDKSRDLRHRRVGHRRKEQEDLEQGQPAHSEYVDPETPCA